MFWIENRKGREFRQIASEFGEKFDKFRSSRTSNPATSSGECIARKERNKSKKEHMEEHDLAQSSVLQESGQLETQSEHQRASIPHCFSDKSRFANTCLAGDQRCLPMLIKRLLHELHQRIKLRPATDEHRTYNRSSKRYCHRNCLLPDEAAFRESPFIQ